MVISHQATIEMLTQSNVNTFEAHKKLDEEPTKKIVEASERFDKVVLEVTEISFNMTKFMFDFQTSSDKDVSEFNKVIKGFVNVFKLRRKIFQVCDLVFKKIVQIIIRLFQIQL